MTELKHRKKLPIFKNPELYRTDGYGYFIYSVVAEKVIGDTRERFEFDIDLLDISGRPDCRIGNWEINEWVRTPAAMQENWEGYSSSGRMTNAVEKVLQNNRFTIIGWKERS